VRAEVTKKPGTTSKCFLSDNVLGRHLRVMIDVDAAN
jgi:hypothetical protein